MKSARRRSARLGASLVVATVLTGTVGMVAEDRSQAAAIRQELAKVTDRSMPVSKHWSLEQVLAMNHEAALALWKTLPAVSLSEMNGHYTGMLPNAGSKERQARVASHFFDESSVRGYWLGKAYKQTGPNRGEGYNRWRFPGGRIERNLRFSTSIGPSHIDGKPALLMNYGTYNDSTLLDEIRKLDDNIYLGIYTNASRTGGRTAPEHFVLLGPTDEWVGPDAVPTGTTSSRPQ